MGRGLYENRSNMHPTTKAALVLIFLAVLTDHIRAAQVQVQPDRALLNEGQKTELLCRYEKQIHYCRIEIPGEGRILNLSPIWNKTPGFTYFGAGLEAGECGVTIERVNASQNGKVKCTLGGEGDEYEGTIELVIALRPQQPVIELLSKPERDESFAADSLFNARCVVRDGRPAANISWFIDDMPIVQGLSEPNVIDSMSDKNVTLSTTEQRMQKYLTPEDDGKMLICRAHHQTDRDQPQEGKFPLRVRYSPVPQPDATVYGLYLEHTAMVNVTIRANPTPTTEWTIEGIAIPQGTQQGRFSAYEPINIGNGYYNVTLAIAGLTLEDTTKTYYLKASNALGVRDYTVRISSSSTPPSAGLDIGSIVGIAVAVAFLVIVILLIGFARVTGRWCFGGATLNTDIGPDSEAQINPHLNDDFDGRDFSGDQHIDTTPQSEEVTPPVTDKLEAQKKADLKNSKNINGHHNGAKSSKTQASETHDETHQGPGPNVALLESGMTPNGVTILNNNNSNHNENGNSNGNQNAMNGRQRSSASLMVPLRMSGRGNDDDDDSFEYATDRESSVYNPTTVPLKGGRSSATSRQSTGTTASDSPDQQQPAAGGGGGGDLLARANQVGIPESRCSRWIPKDQRELLERHKNSERNQVNKQNQYFESSSDTESADIKTESKSHAAKSQRLPSFTSLFMRKNEKSKKDSTLAADQTGNAAEGEQNSGETNRAAGADGGRVAGASTAGNANQPEEDKQIVYAELVLKPSDNQPIPQKNSTEYAEIVYVQKPTPGTVAADSADSKGKI